MSNKKTTKQQKEKAEKQMIIINSDTGYHWESEHNQWEGYKEWFFSMCKYFITLPGW